jgi:FMN reductase
MAKLVIISGSPSAKSRLNGVLEHAYEALKIHGHQLDLIYVRDLPAEDLLHARFDSPAIIEAQRLVEQADAILIATPIYKASYTGILKAFLDLLPLKGLERKTILPIAIGGTIAHLLAIDYAIKPLLSVLGARDILGGVYVLDTQVTWTESGSALLSDEIAARLDAAIQEFSQEAIWQEKNRVKLKGA